MKIYPSAHLAKPQEACYIRFARNEDKSILLMMGRTLCNAAGRVSFRSTKLQEDAGPLRPDFSKPKYAQIEYIWVSKGGYHADRWNLTVPTISETRFTDIPVPGCAAASALPTAPARFPCRRWNGRREVERETAHLYERVKNVIPPVEWPFMAPYVKAINELKKTRNAVILAHNYQTPEIFHCVADIVGDFAAARRSKPPRSKPTSSCSAACTSWPRRRRSSTRTRRVLIPDSRAGCSLAASITGADVRLLRQRYPGVPVVTYVNTSADVKAEVDICCTSSNAVQVVESLGAPTVIFLPDQYLAQIRRLADRGEDHRLEGRLRGARALHRRRNCAPIARPTRRCRSSPIRNARPTCWRRPTSPARPRT